jgi:glutaminyl-tRNA synthetase
VVQALVEPGLVHLEAGAAVQFERHGYFVADRVDHAPGRAVFNLAVGLKDQWSKG